MNEIEFHKLRYAWDKDYVDNLGHLEPKKEKKMNEEVMDMAPDAAEIEQAKFIAAQEATTAPTADAEVLGYGQTGEGEVATATDVAAV